MNTCPYCPSTMPVDAVGRCGACGRISPYALAIDARYCVVCIPAGRKLPLMPWLDPPPWVSRLKQKAALRAICARVRSVYSGDKFQVTVVHQDQNAATCTPWYAVDIETGQRGYLDSTALVNVDLGVC